MVATVHAKTSVNREFWSKHFYEMNFHSHIEKLLSDQGSKWLA